MAEKKAEGPLQQYLVLAKNTKGKAAGPLVLQALGASGLYHFGELISHPNIAPLERDDKPIFDALRIFAYGTLADYKNASGLPELSPAMLTKLRQLTIVSLATDSKVIPYSVLSTQLGIQNLRELEDLIIDTLYAGLIRGKLDQKEKQLEVDWAVARDLRPGQVEAMIAFLNNWVATSDVLLKAIEEQVNHAASVHEANRVHKKEFDERVENIKANLKAVMDADVGGDYIPGSEMYDDDRKGKKGGPPKRGGPGRKGPKRGFMNAREWFN